MVAGIREMGEVAHLWAVVAVVVVAAVVAVVAVSCMDIHCHSNGDLMKRMNGHSSMRRLNPHPPRCWREGGDHRFLNACLLLLADGLGSAAHGWRGIHQQWHCGVPPEPLSQQRADWAVA